jgi:L-amino acid N-acyltransferase YncA
MFPRLALAHEEDVFVEMGKANVAETLAGEPCDEARLREVFQEYLATARPTVWFVEAERRPIGMLMADVGQFDYRAGLFVVQKVIYVSPEKRGTRAAVLLVKELIRWSRHIGASEIIGGNDNGFNSDRTAAFLGHFGFRKVGFTMSLSL